MPRESEASSKILNLVDLICIVISYLIQGCYFRHAGTADWVIFVIPAKPREAGSEPEFTIEPDAGSSLSST